MKNNVAGVLVLMYHRIDNTETDPWNICVSPERFEAHVRFLKNNFNVIEIEELINQIKQNNIVHNSVCITFDDGYADNFIHAKPILEKYDCPAAFFISTALIGNKIFWWDELERIFLHQKKLPHYLFLQVEDRQCNYYIKETVLISEQFATHKNWRWYDDAPTSRCEIFSQIRSALQPLHFSKIKKIINDLNSWAESETGSHLHRYTMSEEQLKLMAQHKLFTIGLHTHTHADLEHKSKIVQRNEIAVCKKQLHNKFNIQSNVLAYPYGLFDENTLTVSKNLNLDACFTTQTGMVCNKSNLYALNRIQICDWDVDYLEQQLQDILTATFISS